jgi:V/A-type H+-transporting ATPase subunit C
VAGGVSGYAALNARVRIMYSYLLTPTELATMSEAPDLASLVASLRRTQYGPYLDKLKDKEFTAHQLVSEIKEGLAAKYQTVIQSAPLQARRVLVQLYRHFEVNNLKAVLRGIAAGGSDGTGGGTWDQIRDLLFPFGASTVLPAEAMLQTGSVAAAVELLRATRYYEPLSQALKRYTAERNLFPLEVALDLHYWRQLWQEARKLPVEDQTQALRVLGALVDMNNLMWAIRYRVYQELSEEELINYTLPFGHRVRDEDIRAVAAGADLGSVVGRLYPNLPGIDTLLPNPKKSLPSLELSLKRHVIRECLAAFVGDPFHVGLPLAYLLLQDLEIEDLVVLIEAKASKLPLEKFSPFLHPLFAASS